MRTRQLRGRRGGLEDKVTKKAEGEVGKEVDPARSFPEAFRIRSIQGLVHISADQCYASTVKTHVFKSKLGSTRERTPLVHQLQVKGSEVLPSTQTDTFPKAFRKGSRRREEEEGG